MRPNMDGGVASVGAVVSRASTWTVEAWMEQLWDRSIARPAVVKWHDARALIGASEGTDRSKCQPWS